MDTYWYMHHIGASVLAFVSCIGAPSGSLIVLSIGSPRAFPNSGVERVVVPSCSPVATHRRFEKSCSVYSFAFLLL